MTILGRDDFTGSGQLTSHTPSGPGAVVGSSWSLAHGTATAFVLSGGVLTFATSNFLDHLAVYNGPSSYGDDYTSSFVINWASYSNGEHHPHLASRAASATAAAYRAGYDTVRQRFELYRTDAAGNETLLANYPFAKRSSGTNTLTLVTCGTVLRVLLDGVVIIDKTDTTLTTGLAGIGYSSNGPSPLTVDNWTLDTVDTAPYELAFTTQPSTTGITGSPLTTQPVVAVRDIGKRTVTSDTSTVTLTRNIVAGTGTLTGTASQAASSGVATFSGLSLSSSGTYTLTASDGSLQSATSSQFSIFGTPTALVIVQQPAGFASGSSCTTPAIVEVRDSDNVTITNWVGSILATKGAGSAALSGPTRLKDSGTNSFFSMKNGRATFYKLALIGPGSGNTITFSATGLTSATSDPITVTAQTGTFDGVAELPRSVPNIPYPTSFTGGTTTITAASLPDPLTALRNAINTYAAIAGSSENYKIVLADDIGTITMPSSMPNAEIVLPVRGAGSTGLIVIEPQTWPALPGHRVTPSNFTVQTKFLANSVESVFRAESASSYYYVMGLELSVTPTTSTNIGLVAVGSDGYARGSPLQTTVAQVPHHFVFDRNYVHGTATAPSLGSRGFALHGANTVIINNHVEDFHSNSGEAQALAFLNGTGPYLIANNNLQGSTETMIFGGGSSKLPSTVDVNADITVCQNYWTRPVSWKGTWPVKNLLDTKTCTRVLFEGNVMENTWTGGGQDALVVLKGTDQDGIDPWATSTDIVFRYNFLRNGGGGLVVASNPEQYQAIPESRVVSHDNVWANINSADGTYNGSGRFTQLGGWPPDLSLRHELYISAGSSNIAMLLTPVNMPKGERFSCLDMIFTAPSSFGVQGDAIGAGTDATTAYLDSPTFGGVVFGGSNTSVKDAPLGTRELTGNAAIGFTDLSITSTWDTADPDVVCAALTLVPGSKYSATGTNPATDGKDRGPDMTAVRSAIAGVWDGSYVLDAGVSGVADHLSLTVQPSATTISGSAHAQQPAGVVKDASDALVSSNTSTMVATWVGSTGSAIGTTSVAAVAGAWTFAGTGLGVSAPLGDTGHWHIAPADGSFTGVDSSTITITADVVIAAVNRPGVITYALGA